MSINSKIQIQNQAIESMTPRVIFRLPGEISSVFMAGDLKFQSIEQWPEKEGFVFAPFKPSESNPVIFLQPTVIQAKADESSFFPPGNSFALTPGNNAEGNLQVKKKEYLQNLEALILQLRAGVAEKVVISRTSEMQSIPAALLPSLYRELGLQYPTAFVYLAYLPPYGTWMGASPETLITCRGNHCSTMSLAGTRAAGAKGEWGNKEIEEQAIVTRFIKEKVESMHVQNLEISKPFSLPAGLIEHLCTTFYFNLPNPATLASLVRQLHPTPAVCGIPTGRAMQLIAQFEKHDREYYTGFLGPVNHNQKTELFVNLRCMKITAQQMMLYSGGGITSDSVPEKEWEETELKTRTLMAVIKKIQNLAL